VTGEVERRVVAQLLTLLDGLEPRQNVIVIGATNRIDAVDEALRRPGRFDREIIIGVPDVTGRREILAIHTRGMPLDEDVDLDELARISYGYVGADMAALAREAAMETLRRFLPEMDLESGQIDPGILEKLRVTRDDFMNAIRRIQPSALREIMIEVPNVGWDDIGGLEGPKRELREGIELPLKHPEAFQRLGIRAAKGFLLFGPPGTGKTLLAKAVAREAEANFIATKSSDLLSKWYGESEQQIARLFQRARQVAPTVIFIDEIDSLAPARGGGLGEPAVTERVVNTLLAEMDGLEELRGVVVIAASNRPALLDPALLRPGRFDDLVYVPVPGARGAPAHPPYPHRRNAPRGRRRSRSPCRSHPGLHGRRPRGPRATRRPRGPARRHQQRNRRCEPLRGSTRRDQGVGHEGDGAGVRGAAQDVEERESAWTEADRVLGRGAGDRGGLDRLCFTAEARRPQRRKNGGFVTIGMRRTLVRTGSCGLTRASGPQCNLCVLGVLPGDPSHTEVTTIAPSARAARTLAACRSTGCRCGRSLLTSTRSGLPSRTRAGSTA